MDATERFIETVDVPAADVRLDVASLCIAAHAHAGLDVDACCRRLDDLAEACPGRDFDTLRRHLFEHERFRGNTDDYGDPENSFLDSVLARRTGIPITLCVLTMEVGRRLGARVAGVGMPGHFLVREGGGDAPWCDPFHGGARLRIEECRALFARVHGSDREFEPAHLGPVSPHMILARMLANLTRSRLGAEPTQLRWLCELQLALPDLDAGRRARLEATVRAVRARWN